MRRSRAGDDTAEFSRRVTRVDALRNNDLAFAAAKECFNKLGPSTSMEDIARRAGVGVATLYRAFGNRAGLAQAVLKEMLDEVAESATRRTIDGDPWGALVGWLQAYVEQLRSKQALINTLQSLFSQNPEVLSNLCLSAARDLERVLVPAQTAGLVRPDLTAVELMQLANGITTGMVPHERMNYLLEIILEGIRSHRDLTNVDSGAQIVRLPRHHESSRDETQRDDAQ